MLLGHTAWDWVVAFVRVLLFFSLINAFALFVMACDRDAPDSEIKMFYRTFVLILVLFAAAMVFS